MGNLEENRTKSARHRPMKRLRQYVSQFLFPKREPLPPSDLLRVEFLREGKDGKLWKYHLDGPDAKLWDECLRANLRSSKGFIELNWQREEITKA